MSALQTTLGPLELIDGRCLVGDFRRPGGFWVEFQAEGLYHHTGAPEGELIPWTEIVRVKRVVVGRGSPSKGGNFTLPGLLAGRLPGLKGRLGGHLDLTLCDPYEERSLRFDRHSGWYRLKDLAILEELLRQTVASDEPHLLADEDWMRRVIERLRPMPSVMSASKFERAVAQARQAEESSGI